MCVPVLLCLSFSLSSHLTLPPESPEEVGGQGKGSSEQAPIHLQTASGGA